MIRHSNTPAHLQNMKIMKEVHSSKEASSVIDQLTFEGTREELVIKLELSLCLGPVAKLLVTGATEEGVVLQDGLLRWGQEHAQEYAHP